MTAIFLFSILSACNPSTDAECMLAETAIVQIQSGDYVSALDTIGELAESMAE